MFDFQKMDSYVETMMHFLGESLHESEEEKKKKEKLLDLL